MLEMAPQGLYCDLGDFYIDPSRAVEHALITHAHSDHARKGSKNYWCVESSTALVLTRLGRVNRLTAVKYGQKIKFGKVWVSFHPAGHILGSAQIRIESENEVWAVSGDFKRGPDPSCEEFEVIPCDTWITEATFGLPVYQWPPITDAIQEIYAWWMANRAEGRASLLYAYSLGKTQRVLTELFKLFPSLCEKVYLHPAAVELTECYRRSGILMLATRSLADCLETESLAGQMIIAPSSSSMKDWINRLGSYEEAFASGWMLLKKARFGRGLDRGFVVSDHADFSDLVQTACETGAKQVYVMYGDHRALARQLEKRGIRTGPVTDLKPGAKSHRREKAEAPQGPVQLSLF